MERFLNSMNLINAKVMIYRSTYSYDTKTSWSVEITGEIEGTVLTIKTTGAYVEQAVDEAEKLWNKRTRHIPELNPMLTYQPAGVVTEDGGYVSDDF